MSESEKSYCGECRKLFSKHCNLRAHVKRKHPDKLEILAPKIKSHSGSLVKCLSCDKKFVYLKNLNRHIKRKHPDKLGKLARVKSKVLKCPLCQYTDASRDALIIHYRGEHLLEINYENIEFESFEAFQLWKSKVEEQTFASFVNRGIQKSKQYSIIQYTCHRSGEFKTRGNNIRQLKTQGSNKIGGYCPAKISVVLKRDLCEVQFCKSHVGHRQEQDLGHIFLTKSQRHNIAAKIAAKIPLQAILDEIRDSISKCHLERLHLLTKKDLFNIEYSFKLNGSSMRHVNDAISVESWVNELKCNGSILCYKPQESVSEEHPQLKPEDFVLIIMTEGQKNLLLRFGDDCICVDGTHGLNGYGFELHTILILDDLREGCPCAFLISNRSDFTVMQIFFSCVEEKIDKKIRPRVFMSDMAEAYYNAWVQVMHPATFRLFCTWHVDKAWRKNLEKVASKEKKVRIYQMLRMILQERDVSAFKKLLHKFVMYCQEDPETLEFANYFDKYYVCKVEQWAYCFRLNSGLNTNCT